MFLPNTCRSGRHHHAGQLVAWHARWRSNGVLLACFGSLHCIGARRILQQGRQLQRAQQPFTTSEQGYLGYLAAVSLSCINLGASRRPHRPTPGVSACERLIDVRESINAKTILPMYQAPALSKGSGWCMLRESPQPDAMEGLH